MQTNPVVWTIYSGINKNFKAFVLESDVIEIPINDFSILQKIQRVIRKIFRM